MRKALVTLAAVACLGLAGCGEFATGRPITVTPAQQEQLIVGKTTKEDLIKMFGQPQAVTQHEGREAWTWFHSSAGMFGSNLQTQNFSAKFNDDGTLYEYINNAGTDNSSPGLR